MKTMIVCAVFLVSQVPAFAETVMKELVNRAGGKDSVAPVEITVVAPLKEDVVFPPKPEIKLSALQMERLLNLARYAHDNKPDGIEKGVFVTVHSFQIGEDKLADGSFRLNWIQLKRNGLDYFRTFTVYPDGTVDNRAAVAEVYFGFGFIGPYKSRLLDKDLADMLMDEVALWVDYETKRGRYPPNAIPEPLELEPATP